MLSDLILVILSSAFGSLCEAISKLLLHLLDKFFRVIKLCFYFGVQPLQLLQAVLGRAILHFKLDKFLRLTVRELPKF